MTSNHEIASSSLVVGILLAGVPCYTNTRLGSIPRVIIILLNKITLKLGGAVGAREAHNLKVDRSKLSSAI